MAARRQHQSKANMKQVVAGLATTADRIRALAKAGHPRADIARYLKIRYQQVRNVLVRDQALREEAAAYVEQDLKPEWLRVGADGRVVIPAAYRKLLGIEAGGPIQIRIEDGKMELLSRDEVVRRVQAHFAHLGRKGVSLSDELIADRRAEVAREEREERGRHRS
jgi:AbrB family looped-hinge helix DNA binding protein